MRCTCWLVEGQPALIPSSSPFCAGQWEFTLLESADGASVVLDVDVGRYLDTSLIQVEAGL